MFNPVLGRISLAVGALLSVAALPVSAASSIEESLALSMSKGIRDRMFWNVQIVSAKTKTKSEEPRDVTPGGVVRISELKAMAADYSARGAFDGTVDEIKLYQKGISYTLAAASLGGAILQDNPGQFPNADSAYLATPKGILAKSGDPSPTVALSVGYYLTDAHTWVAEALVLGAPVRATVYGAGSKIRGQGASARVVANDMNGEELIQTKMLPPILKVGYEFGDRSWLVRPYVGVAAMYAIFFDTKPTSYFNRYQGGKTTVSIKNSFGVGPMLGLTSGDLSDSGWRVGFSVGKVRLRTEATLVTRGTMIDSDTPVTNDYGDRVNNAIKNIGEVNLRGSGESGYASLINDAGYASQPPLFPNGFTTELLKDLAAFKQQQGTGDGTLGTFVRKQKTTLDNTLFMLSVGRSF